MTSFEYDHQQCHHAAVGVSIFRLALAPVSTATPISSSAAATIGICKSFQIRVRKHVWVWIRRDVRELLHLG